jgi:DNA-binding response OmpR family regulator
VEVWLQKRVLIVGSSPELGAQLSQVLTAADLEVFAAADSVGGLFQFGLVRPHLVILDCEELETLQRFRALSCVPIIFLAPDDWWTGAESLHHGADFFVTKPLRLGEFGAKVRAALRRT